jgi:hypothetical protein
MSSTVNWATSAAATATAIAANINANQSNYLAYVKDSTCIQFHAVNFNIRPDILAFTASGFTPTMVQLPTTDFITMASYNVPGQIYNGHFSDTTIAVARMTIPKDSLGTSGEPFMSMWFTKNF